MTRKIEGQVIEKIFERALEINSACHHECRDFRIMTSPNWHPTLILRWMTIDLSNADNPKQCYHYECFYTDGTPQHCSIHYGNQKEANNFFFSLRTLYKQDFANDHKLKEPCTKSQP